MIGCAKVSFIHVKIALHPFKVKDKVGVLHPIQQSGSYWDRPSPLSLVGVEAT